MLNFMMLYHYTYLRLESALTREYIIPAYLFTRKIWLRSKLLLMKKYGPQNEGTIIMSLCQRVYGYVALWRPYVV